MICKKKNIKNYFIKDTEIFYSKNTKKRINFLSKNKFFYNEISSLLGNIIGRKKSILFFCCGNSTIRGKIETKKSFIHDINDEVVNNFFNFDDDHLIKDDESIILFLPFWL